MPGEACWARCGTWMYHFSRRTALATAADAPGAAAAILGREKLPKAPDAISPPGVADDRSAGRARSVDWLRPGAMPIAS